jgi:hypothetical protein
MSVINQRIIGLPENKRNRDVLHINPTFGIHNIPYDRYQNNKIFQMKDNTPSINSRIGMSQNTSLIAHPCESLNERLNDRQQGGFRNNHYEVKPATGLNNRFFTNDRLFFTHDFKQEPQINKIY